jgi:hypothetical protein
MKNWTPYLFFSDKFLDSISWFMKIGGISIFPVIVLREKYNIKHPYWKKAGNVIINHERIHFQQALELLVIPFYVIYVLEWLFKLPFYGKEAYKNISFEKEAYSNQIDLQYLKNRKRYNWIKLIF